VSDIRSTTLTLPLTGDDGVHSNVPLADRVASGGAETSEYASGSPSESVATTL
jgi:hypothetical protein